MARPTTSAAMPPARVFDGMTIRIYGFSSEDETKYADAIRRGGGLLAKLRTATHFVGCSDSVTCEDDGCVAARADGAAVLNEFWLDDCTRLGVVVNQEKVMYILPKNVRGIENCSCLQVFNSDYIGDEKTEVERLIDLMGATYADEFNADKVTHLLCKSPHSQQYTTAKIKGLEVVSKSWLEHCLIEWRILPVGVHGDLSAKLLCSYTPNPLPTEPKVQHPQKYIKANTTCRRASNPPVKRPLSRVVRVLDFQEDDLIPLSAYVAMVGPTEQISIPEHRVHQEETKPLIKKLLLAAYVLLLMQELEQKTLNGSYSFKDFRVAPNSKEVTLQNVHPLPYSEAGSTRDRERFVKNCNELFGGADKVPTDVAVWLSSIKKGVNAQILRKHINMQHPNEAFGSFMTLYQAFKDLPFSAKLACKKKMHIYDDWMEYGFKWRLLNKSLIAKKEMVRQKNEDKLRASAREGDVSGKGEEKDEEAYNKDVDGLLTFLRDSFMHPAKRHQRYMLLALSMDYPYLLASLQDWLALHLWLIAAAELVTVFCKDSRDVKI